MPRPYSGDLRARALAACDAGERPGAAAERFGVARATVDLWLQQRRDGGRTEAKRLGGGGPQRVIRDGVAAALARLVEAANDRTLAGYADRLEAATGVRAAPSMVCRALRRLGLPRNKDPARRRAGHGGGGTRARADWRAKLSGVAPQRLVFIEERAALTTMVRPYARSPRGERARGTRRRAAATGGAPASSGRARV
jgi:transposase